MTQQPHSFEAFGQRVSEHRKNRGLTLLKSHYANLSEMEIDFVLSCAIRAIEKDRIAYLWSDVQRYIDLTFYYMLLAHLCTDEGFPT